MHSSNIDFTGYELFLLSILAIVFFRYGRRRKYLYGSLLFKKRSNGSIVTVEENLSKNIRVMKRDGKVLSGADLSTKEPTSNVLKYPHLTELFPMPPKKILCLGGATCAYPTFAFENKKGLSFDILEIDPVVIEASKKFFLLPATRSFKLIQSDALRWIENSNKNYDLIFVDVGIVLSKNYPLSNEVFVSARAFSAYKKLLGPNGSLLINIITTLNPGDIKIVSQQFEPLKSYFKSYLSFRENLTSGQSQLQEIVHIFSKQKVDLTFLRKSLRNANEDNLSYSKHLVEKLLGTYLQSFY